MSDSTLVVWDDVFTSYDFGHSHPMRPLRLELTMALAGQLGVLDRPGVRVAAPTPAGDDLLELVHDPLYVASVKRAPDDLLGRLSLRWGLGNGDNPVFPQMHEVSALVTGATVDAAKAVWTGTAQHAVNVSGGLHHAMRDRASGFCVYDDPAVAIAWLLAQGATRVAYVDVDVHHGDGVEAAFYGDPRVLTVSVHESGRTLFPGSGWPEDVGMGEGLGTNVNLALPAGTGDSGWLRAFDAVVPQVLRAYRPQVLVTQHGCDTHALDPLAHLLMSVDGQRVACAALHRLAHELCNGRWVALGGGGYEPVQVVPRAWTHLLAEAAGDPGDELGTGGHGTGGHGTGGHGSGGHGTGGHGTGGQGSGGRGSGWVDGATPENWRAMAGQKGGEVAPTSMTDGATAEFTAWEGGEGVPGDPCDAAVAATRRATFRLLGLDPLAAAG